MARYLAYCLLIVRRERNSNLYLALLYLDVHLIKNLNFFDYVILIEINTLNANTLILYLKATVLIILLKLEFWWIGLRLDQWAIILKPSNLQIVLHFDFHL